VWVDSDAVRPGREWRGDHEIIGLIDAQLCCKHTTCYPGTLYY